MTGDSAVRDPARRARRTAIVERGIVELRQLRDRYATVHDLLALCALIAELAVLPDDDPRESGQACR